MYNKSRVYQNLLGCRKSQKVVSNVMWVYLKSCGCIKNHQGLSKIIKVYKYFECMIGPICDFTYKSKIIWGNIKLVVCIKFIRVYQK